MLLKSRGPLSKDVGQLPREAPHTSSHNKRAALVYSIRSVHAVTAHRARSLLFCGIFLVFPASNYVPRSPARSIHTGSHRATARKNKGFCLAPYRTVPPIKRFAWRQSTFDTVSDVITKTTPLVPNVIRYVLGTFSLVAQLCLGNQ